MTEKNISTPHERLGVWLDSARFTNFIIAVILFNAVVLGLETNDALRRDYAGLLLIIDRVIISIFVIELSLKIYAYRGEFFKSGWNLFDLVIVGVSLLPATGPFAVLRIFRVFRVMRLISVIPQMRLVVGALLGALPGMATIVAVLTIFFYVAAILATQAFGTHPDPTMQELFGSFGASLYTLFQVMTLEGWAENIVNPTRKLFPWALYFFIPFIVITTFAALNLFIGVIVDSMETIRRKPQEDKEQILIDEVRALRAEVKALGQQSAQRNPD
jgi:voltage-gated sodium channel